MKLVSRMRFLFIHQNFPGQFRHVARALADTPGAEVVGIGDAANLKGQPPLHSRIRVLAYRVHGGGRKETHHYLRDFEGHVRRGQAVVRLLLKLRDEDRFQPDVVIAHPGWGEGLFVRDVFPSARVVQYFEYFYHGSGGDVGFDPEFPCTLDDQLRVRIKNSTQLQSLIGCDQGISPTQWQRSRYPVELRSKIEVLHEGVDTEVLRPNPVAWIEVNGRRFHAGDEIVTYVARNLEPYRGFHSFIRSLPTLQALRPNAVVLIVGGDAVSYGKRLPEGETYRQQYCGGLRDQIDWSKVFFVGTLPYSSYMKVLQVSAVHVYLTYPFVLSWSLLEAMSSGCLVVASDTAPVREVIQSGVTGALVDFFDYKGLGTTIAEALSKPQRYIEMRALARQSIRERYDLRTVCLPKILPFLQYTGSTGNVALPCCAGASNS
ncbi:MAG: glycosyltransferase family 4 protein [Rhodocyclaceae bacterium]|nr:glycosyltransferase family 4 protein [Rhodocyclaceae bacterium]